MKKNDDDDDEMSALYKSCYSQICSLHIIWPYIDHKAASTCLLENLLL